MISIVQLAAIFENALNALRAPTEEWEFKIWANVGKYKKSRKQGNKVFYFINGSLAPTTTAIDPNILPMGVNGLNLVFLVPTNIPRTNITQSDTDLEKIKEGQIVFVNRIAQILTAYFTVSQALVMTDENGESFACSLVGGIAIPENIDLYVRAGEAVPLSVSVTLNFVLGGINALNVKLYMDGERVPYMMFNPSRSTALATDVQSNDTEQKSLATSSVYGIQFTAPSSVANAAAMTVYDFISDETNVNTAHFIEVEWGSQRADTYLMFLTSANITAQGADFAGINASLAKVYGNEEYFNFPSEFETGHFSSQVSSAAFLSFEISATFKKVYKAGTTPPDTYPLYYYIAGKAYSVNATLSDSSTGSDGEITATYNVTQSVQTDLTASDYDYDEKSASYRVWFTASQAVSVTGVTPGFAYSEV